MDARNIGTLFDCRLIFMVKLFHVIYGYGKYVKYKRNQLLISSVSNFSN